MPTKIEKEEHGGFEKEPGFDIPLILKLLVVRYSRQQNFKGL
jgi:hypothetical protein